MATWSLHSKEFLSPMSVMASPHHPHPTTTLSYSLYSNTEHPTAQTPTISQYCYYPRHTPHRAAQQRALQQRRRRRQLASRKATEEAAATEAPARMMLRFRTCEQKRESALRRHENPTALTHFTLGNQKIENNRHSTPGVVNGIKITIQGHTGLRRGVALAARRLGLPAVSAYRVVLDGQADASIEVNMSDHATHGATLLESLHAPFGATVTLIPLQGTDAETKPARGSDGESEYSSARHAGTGEDVDSCIDTDTDEQQRAHTPSHIISTTTTTATAQPKPQQQQSFAHNPYAAFASPPPAAVPTEIAEPTLPDLNPNLVLHPRLQARLTRATRVNARRCVEDDTNSLGLPTTPSVLSGCERRLGAASPESVESYASLSSIPMSVDSTVPPHSSLDAGEADVDCLLRAAQSAHYEEGDWGRAVCLYNQALSLEPNHVGCLSHRAYLHESFGEWQQALSDYHELVRLQPLVAFWRAKRAAIFHYRLGDADAAYADYGHLLLGNPSDIEARLNRATLLVWTYGRPDMAMSDLEHARVTAPCDSRVGRLRNECLALLAGRR